MLFKWAKMLLLSGVVTGLCASVQANTTDTADRPLAVNEAAAPLAAPAAPAIRIGLLLPLRSGVFGGAADAVRIGFLTAYEHDKQDATVNLIESGETPADMLKAYVSALGSNDVIVGPLSRSAAAAVAQSGRVDKPTVALTQPEGDPDAVMPPKMLVMALSVEEEARQAANWTEQEKIGGGIFAVSTATAWQRRAVKAFAAQGKTLGLKVAPLELSVTAGALSANGLVQLKQRIDAEHPALLFVALDAAQAKQLRSAIGTDMPLYGISQMNPRSVSADPAFMLEPELDGVKLVDIPWQVLPDDPAVKLYPRPVIEDSEKHNADLDRLYALGIDAYRVAHEIGRGRHSFDIDGVTGKLNVNIDYAGSRFQRTEIPAVYQNGVVVPTADQR
jgi:outer membrane PBP1 activator LpoA protein